MDAKIKQYIDLYDKAKLDSFTVYYQKCLNLLKLIRTFTILNLINTNAPIRPNEKNMRVSGFPTRPKNWQGP